MIYRYAGIKYQVYSYIIYNQLFMTMLNKILGTLLFIFALLFGGFLILAVESNGRISRAEFSVFAFAFIGFTTLVAIWGAYKGEASSAPSLL